MSTWSSVRSSGIPFCGIRSWKIAFAFLVAASICAGQTAPAGAPSASAAPQKGSGSPAAKPGDAQPQTPETTRYVLGPNDVVQVLVYDDKTLSNTYVIGPDGLMSMPLIDDFKAAGLTTLGLRDLITEKLRDLINDPQVSVQLLRINSKRYLVLGGVLKSGPYTLLQDTTILEALGAAGGFKDFAKPTKIFLIRKDGTKHSFNYKDVSTGKHMEQNILVEDGDIINVPE
jgi:polysaccharide export outer membrane protein